MSRIARYCPIILALWLGLALTATAQDPLFSQFYANPLHLNPAFAGTANCPRVALNYRNQWPAITGGYATYSASYDKHSPLLNGGLGIHVMNDRQGQGVINTTSVNGMYAYQMKPNRNWSVRAGFQASYFQRSIDWNQLRFGDQIHDRYGFIYQTSEIPGQNTQIGIDFSTGFVAYSDIYYIGAAVHHLTEPELSGQSQLPRKYTAHAGAAIPLSDSRQTAVLSPNVIYQLQGTAQQLNLGLYLSNGPIVGGLWYRHRDAFIAMIGVHSGPMKIGYSYDITISQLTVGSGGAHEVSCHWAFPCRKRPKKHQIPPCPDF